MSEIHETCQDIIILHGKTVIKISQHFMKVWLVLCLKPIRHTYEIRKPILVFSDL